MLGLKSLEAKIFPKEVAAQIIGYNYKTNNVAATVNGKEASMPMDDISIYKNNNKSVVYLNRLLGTEVKCEVVGYDDMYILSRKKLMDKKVKQYQVDDIVEATVVSFSDRALYLEFDEGLSGIMYFTEITSAKLRKPSDLYSIGDKITCKIIKKKDTYFELSRLKLYDQVSLYINRGDIVQCKITKKLDDESGYFVELIANPKYSGIFDINQNNKNNIYNVGDNISLRVLDINEKKQLRLRTLI